MKVIQRKLELDNILVEKKFLLSDLMDCNSIKHKVQLYVQEDDYETSCNYHIQ